MAKIEGEMAMSAQVPDSTGQPVVFRLDRGFRKPLVIRGVLALVVAGLAAAAGTALGTPMFVLAGLCGLVAAGSAVGYVWRGRFRTVLTPEGIHVRGYFNHFVPWSDVAGVKVSSRGSAASSQEDDGTSTGERIETYWPGPVAGGAISRPHLSAGSPPYQLDTVHVVRTRGRRLTLPAPRVTRWQDDSEFYDKAGLIEQWRQRYSAPSALPRSVQRTG